MGATVSVGVKISLVIEENAFRLAISRPLKVNFLVIPEPVHPLGRQVFFWLFFFGFKLMLSLNPPDGTYFLPGIRPKFRPDLL